jgi:hypothetical protein
LPGALLATGIADCFAAGGLASTFFVAADYFTASGILFKLLVVADVPTGTINDSPTFRFEIECAIAEATEPKLRSNTGFATAGETMWTAVGCTHSNRPTGQITR